MKILITGGTGLIGQALIRKLLTNHHELIVLTRNPEKAKESLPASVSVAGWDAETPAGWGHLIEETDAIINLAGESIGGETPLAIFTRRWTETQKERILNSRIHAGKALVSATQAAKTKPQILIQASAVGYYGAKNDEPVSENAKVGKDFLAGVCKAWEDSTSEVEEMGVRRAVIRTGLVLAPQGGILSLMLLPFRLFTGGPLGTGKQGISWIHLEDHINAICFLLENETAQGAYNLTAPAPVNNSEFGKIAGRALRRPNWLPTPAFALKIVLGEKSFLVLKGQHVLPKRLLEADYTFKHKTLAMALENLL